MSEVPRAATGGARRSPRLDLAFLLAPNTVPAAGPAFPPAWQADLGEMLTQRALVRAQAMSLVLLWIEGALLVFDFWRIDVLRQGPDNILIWRACLVYFLLLDRFALARWIAPARRVRIFLACCVMLFAAGTAVLVGTFGDTSLFSMAVLAVAALTPLPGRFNQKAFAAYGLLLIAVIFFYLEGDRTFWAVNVVATCVIGAVIERLCFEAAVREFTHRKELEQQREEVERQRARVDELLNRVFPASIAASLKLGDRSVAQHSEVTILFADVVGFTALASRLLPSQLVELLEQMFQRFDELAQRHGIEKIKTIGDAYMAIAGAPLPVERPVERMAGFALDMVAACAEIARTSGFDLSLRVGIHSGPAVAGVIGHSRLCYDLWGDSVNLAQRLETGSDVNAICVSEPVYHRLRDRFELTDTGVLDLKGKGAVRTYRLTAQRTDR